MATNANQAIYEATIGHQIKMLRFAEGQAERVVAMLQESEVELLDKITAGMASGRDVSQLEAILAAVQRRRQEVFDAIGKDMDEQLKSFSEVEADWEASALEGSVPVQLNLMDVPLEKLHGIVESPIAGLRLDGWLNNMASGEISALQRAVQQAVVQGETVDQLTARIRGTRAANYQDGILSITRRNAQALARTAVSHVSSGAREQVWEANQDIIRAKRWVSTLDGRTSSICQARDGQMVPVGDSKLEASEMPLNPPGARPPAHFQCRSVLVAVIDGDELAGNRPSVADARTREQREADFRAEAKERGVPISQVRKEWAEKHVGRVPAKMTYEEWLRKQPKELQDEVLGATRAEMFRAGAPLSKFVDASGKRYTIQELRTELAGDALAVAQPAIGLKAKSLLLQGADEDKVLELIKAEYPDAKTTLNSIKSYKSELKTSGQLQSVGPGKDFSPAKSVKDAVDAFEVDLPAGVKHSVAGQWLSVASELEGSPGAYAHYQAGKGVTLSAKALASLPKEHLNQVIAHEFGHMLHKQHGVNLPQLDFMLAKDKAKTLGKEYAYYASHPDELVAEIYAQALSPSALTSQGLDATAFKKAFEDQIGSAKQAIAKHFPAPTKSAPPPPKGHPVLPGETAGKHTTVGGLAKALIQQGLPDEQVLAGVKAQFPDAKTGMASIKSYKSELKKAGLAPTKDLGPVVDAKAPEVPVIDAPPPPTVAAAKPSESVSAVATEAVPTSVWQAKAVEMFQSGVSTGDAWIELQKLFPYNPKLTYPNIASFKSNWKKKLGGAVKEATEKLTEATAEVAGTTHEQLPDKLKAVFKSQKDLDQYESEMGSLLKFVEDQYAANGGKFPTTAYLELTKYVAQDKIPTLAMLAQHKFKLSKSLKKPVVDAVHKVATGAKMPVLHGKPLGPMSSKVYPSLVDAAKKGKTFEESIPIFKKVYGVNFDPTKGTDLWDLAKWDARGKPGLAELEAAKAAEVKAAADAAKAKAAAEQARLNAALKPSRPATTPREGQPPPPRFDQDGHKAGIQKWGKIGDTQKMATINAEQKRLKLEPLTEEEYTAVRNYTGSYYRRLNQALREGQYADDHSLQAFVDAAQSGMRKLPRHTGQTNRGMSLYGQNLEDFLSVYRKGAVIEDHSFVSTSTASGFGGNIRLKFNGKSGVDVAKISHYGHEAEVLFMPGTRFRVDSVTRTGDNVVVEVTEID